jgi:hypothetical protein
MNLNDPQHPWTRLTRAARSVPDARDTAAPYGFATRVAALALAAEQSAGSLLERLSLRALGVACLLTMLTVAANYSLVSKLFTADEVAFAVTSEDPVGELVDAASDGS